MRDDRKTKATLIAELVATRRALSELAASTTSPSDLALESFFSESPMGVHRYRLEPDGGLVFFGANPAADRLLGIDNTQFIGKTIEEAFPPLIETEVPERYREAARDGTSWSTEQIAYEDEQIQGAFEVHAFQISPGHMAALFFDITERKKNEEERRRAEEERRHLEAQVQHSQKLESLGVLAGGIAHDFNNLLAGILGNTSVALLDLQHESPARECIEDVERAAGRAADLVRQLLAYAGKGRFMVDTIDLVEAVTEMGHLLEVSTSKKAEIRYEFATGVPAIRADATQLRQVVMNLITNASEAIGDRSGVIDVRTGVEQCDSAYLAETYLDDELPGGTYCVIEVTDNGIGMDDATRRRIFEPFFSTKFTGRGLGLAAVLGIVRGHEGAIEVHSRVGEGTSVKVLWPTAEEVASPKEKPQPGIEGWHPTGTVMLVDDEEIVRTTAGRMLRRLGFKVITANDGREAVELFSEYQDQVTCVLLDLTMPHMDGEQCFHELRRLQPELRVILSSGYNEQDLVERFTGAGLAGFIQKPYATRALASKLREVLEAT